MKGKYLAGVSAYLLIIAMISIIAVAGVMVLVIGPKLIGFNGISGEEYSVAALTANPELITEAREELGDEVINALDCSTYSPSERRPGVNCIEGLLAAESADNSPVPARAAYMVPIWKAAGKRYGLPWELLAAVQGARSNFALVNCQRSDGDGSYRLYREALRRYGINGGSMILEPSSLGCFEPQAEAPLTGVKGKAARKSLSQRYKPKILKGDPLSSLKAEKAPDPEVDPYDPVDATFTTARMLAERGAFNSGEKWQYSGSPSQQCTVEPSDGRVWYLPYFDLGYGPGARIGFNQRLDIPRRIKLIAAKYRSNTGKYKPRRDPDSNRSPMPKKEIVAILRAVWAAFGARGQELNTNITLNYAQVSRESGGRPYILQGYIGDANDNNPAGGLMQFIPSTFDHWNVDGFNDRFNPLDNILAAVNAQVNGPYPILDGSSGWSPPFSDNPYSSGGRWRLVGAKETVGAVAAKPYKGKPQIDPLSEALRYQRPGQPTSDCYLAVVHDWYKAIKANPPSGNVITGPLRERIIKIAAAELEKQVSETGGDNVPRYRPEGQVADYNFYGPWCQAFAAWVWYQAGIRQITKVPGAMTAGGLALPVYTGAVSAAAQAGQLGMKYKTKNPEPGDLAMYSDRHVEIVEKVKGGRVLSTIGGNTSNAVTRVTAPSGITHFITPPKATGPATYDLGAATPSRSRAFAKLTKRLGVQAGMVSTSGSETQAVGEITSGRAWGTITPVLALAAGDRASKSTIAEMLEVSDPEAWGAVAASLEPKAEKKVNAIFSKSGDRITAANSAGDFAQTIWSGAEANRFFLALTKNKLTKKKETAALLDQLRASGIYRYSVRGLGRDPDRNDRYLLRASYFDRTGARTILISSPSLARAERALTVLARWK